MNNDRILGGVPFQETARRFTESTNFKGVIDLVLTKANLFSFIVSPSLFTIRVVLFVVMYSGFSLCKLPSYELD